MLSPEYYRTVVSMTAVVSPVEKFLYNARTFYYHNKNEDAMFLRKPPAKLLETGQRYSHARECETAARENIEIAKKLIDEGSNVNFVASPNKRVLERLHEEKTSYKGLIGETVLMSYALAGCTDMVEYILQHGGNSSINVRNFGLINLHGYCAQEIEAVFAKHIPQTNDGYRFESALSLAFVSTQANDGKTIQLLLDHGADLSLFYDNEFYRPVLFAGVGTFDDTTGYVRPECRQKVEIILKKMVEENLHLTACKETHKIFSDMLLEHGYRYQVASQSRSCMVS